MAFSLDDVTCRQACIADIDHIVSMRDVYMGLDYLKSQISHYFSNPDIFICYVATFRRQMVGFLFHMLVDDGQTVDYGGVRVHPDFEGKGIASKMKKYAINTTGDYFPKRPTFLVSTAHIEASMEDGIKSKMSNSLVSIRKIDTFFSNTLSMKAHSEPFNRLCQQYATDQVWTPSLPQVLTYLADETVQSTLFPDGRFFALWIPYRLTESNLTYVWHTSLIQMTTTGDRTSDQTWGRSDRLGFSHYHTLVNDKPDTELQSTPAAASNKDGGGRKCEAVSFITCVDSPIGLRYDVEFYGRDERHLVQHVLRSIQYIVEEYGYHGDVCLCLYMPRHIATSTLNTQVFVDHWSDGPWKDNLYTCTEEEFSSS